MEWGINIFGIVSLFIAVGLTMAATTPGEFRLLRLCFWLSAILISGNYLVSQWGSQQSLLSKVLSAACLAAVVFGLLAFGLDWLSRKQVTIMGKGDFMSGDKTSSYSMGNVVGNQGIVTQGQVGNNTIVNAPLSRTIDDQTSSKIIAELRAKPPGKFVPVNYGNDEETFNYIQRIIFILREAGWTMIGDGFASFVQVGGEPLVGLNFCGHSETAIPAYLYALGDILTKYGIAYNKGFTSCPIFAKDDETVGVLIGKRPLE